MFHIYKAVPKIVDAQVHTAIPFLQLRIKTRIEIRLKNKCAMWLINQSLHQECHIRKWSFASSLFFSAEHDGSERLKCTSQPKYSCRTRCRYQPDGNLVGLKKSFWTEDHKLKFSPPTGNQTSALRTTNPHRSLYTNWATLFLRCVGSKKLLCQLHHLMPIISRIISHRYKPLFTH